MNVLIAGWFSFEGMGATAGDLLCRDLVSEWLTQTAIPHTVANAPPFSRDEDWKVLAPQAITHVIFVCGPFGNGHPVTALREKFSHCKWIGLNLSMLDRIENWNPFDLLLERDSDCNVRPDMAFLTAAQRVPVVGVIRAHRQKEYGHRARHDVANAAIDRLLSSREMAIVPIDTRLDEANAGGLRSPAEIESLIARMDAVVTTRLHGTVLALKRGVPALAIDPIAGGAKIQRQVEAIGWPVLFLPQDLTDDRLQQAFAYCLTEEARERAISCRDQARQTLQEVPSRLLEELTEVPAPS